jgi:hypothetical protein
MSKAAILNYIATAIVLSSVSIYAQGGITIKDADLKTLPKEVKYEGKIKSTIRWNDSLGDNILITTETGIYTNNQRERDYEARDAELFAYHYLIKDDAAVQTWRVHDHVFDCPVDIEASFIKEPDVTDLDNNGIAEVWLLYKKVCHGDVSPYNMKIIMYEGNQKFAMRGQNKIFGGTDENGIDHYIGGEYKYDEAFNKGPKEFLKFAQNLWDENIMQKWDE